MSPIYEYKRNDLAYKLRDKGFYWSIFLALVLIIYAFFSAPSLGFSIYYLWLVAPFVGFGNLVGRILELSYSLPYNSEYNKINAEYKNIIKNKKLLNKKEVDKIAKSLSSNSFDYIDVLNILVYFEDLDNHKKQLRKKTVKISKDQNINLKAGEKLLFRTHTSWYQGSPDQNIFKDVGFFYFTNKRIVFIGNIRSYSTSYSKIASSEFGPDYLLVHKTAGPNDIYIFESQESKDCLNKIYDSRA